MANSGKNNFDFRMSKKVAELTQVVHMLFTRNHEKEVELEAVKEAYEYEIELVLKDAQTRIANLNTKIQGLQSASSDAVSAAMARQEQEWQSRLGEAQKHLAQEKQECQHARDLLIRAQHDIEQLHQARAQDEQHFREELNTAGGQISQLRSHVDQLQSSLRDKAGTSDVITQLTAANARLQEEADSRVRQLEEGNKVREQLIARNKQLENDVKQLKRELSKRLASSAKVKEQHPPQPPPVPLDYDAELEMLRAQVQRYRNELTNREMTFNRMFTDKQPVNLSARKGVKLQLTQSPHDGLSMRNSREMTTLTRQKTFFATSSKNSDISDIPDSPRSAKSFDRLPHLEQKARFQKLAKPRPLPRELLSAKAKT